MLQIADSSILLQIDIGVVNLYFKGTARSFQKNWWHIKREWITKICYDVFISNQTFTMLGNYRMSQKKLHSKATGPRVHPLNHQ